MSLKSALRSLVTDLSSLYDTHPGLQYALIGGLAVGAWGHPRATKDIDLLAVTPAGPEALKTDLEKAGYSVDIMRNPDDPIPLLVRVSIPGKKGGPALADMLIATRRVERLIVEGARRIDFENLSLPICRPEDLIAMKLAAGGPYDCLDALEVFKVNEPSIDENFLRDRAKDLKAEKELNTLLENADKE